MASFQNASGSFLDSGNGGAPVTVLVPTTGQTVQLRRGDSWYVKPAGTLAALTLNLPVGEKGKEATVAFSGIITTLAIKDRMGVAVAGAPVAAAAGDVFVWKYVDRTIGWIKWI